MNAAIAISVDWATRHRDGPTNRFLNQPAIRFIGVLSYSLYVWQQLFLNRTSDGLNCAFPLNIILAFTMTVVSCLLIEAPFLQLRRVIDRA